MDLQLTPSPALSPYVHGIWVQEVDDSQAHTNIPLYADGYPGIMFQQAANGFYILPRNKKLSEFFLYGQTLDPISLDVKGPFKFVIFQLYPFVAKYLLSVDPRTLNDDCFDLIHIKSVTNRAISSRAQTGSRLDRRVEIISTLVLNLIEVNQISPDDRIKQAISLILQSEGQTTIREVRDQLFVSERTFERQFLAEVGLTPKQFARIVQFQCSLASTFHGRESCTTTRGRLRYRLCRSVAFYPDF